jgi:hypothetical protein
LSFFFFFFFFDNMLNLNIVLFYIMCQKVTNVREYAFIGSSWLRGWVAKIGDNLKSADALLLALE